MAKGDNKGKGSSARSKPNRGQDENLHAVVNPETGETREVTQREFKTIRDEGFIKQEDAEDVDQDAGNGPVAGDATADAEAPDGQADGGANNAGDVENGSGAGEGEVQQGLPSSDNVSVEGPDPNNYAQASNPEEVGFVNNPVAGGAIPADANGRGTVNGVDESVDSPEFVPTAAGQTHGEPVTQEGDDNAAEGNGGEGEGAGR